MNGFLQYIIKSWIEGSEQWQNLRRTEIKTSLKQSYNTTNIFKYFRSSENALLAVCNGQVPISMNNVAIAFNTAFSLLAKDLFKLGPSIPSDSK